MKQVGIVCIVSLLLTLGAGRADAAPVPTLSVTTSGAADWQLTFDRGSAPKEARCVVRVGDRTSMPPAGVRTMVLRGSAVVPGPHSVRVRCGRSVSPEIWLIAPRNQINDIGTWFSNSTAGLVGY